VVLGRSRSQWERKPVGSDYLQQALSPSLDKTTYTQGDTATLRIHNPLDSPLAPLLAWGNALGRKTRSPAHLPPGDSFLTFQIGEECAGGASFYLSIYLVIYPSIHSSIYLSTYLYLYQYFYLSI